GPSGEGVWGGGVAPGPPPRRARGGVAAVERQRAVLGGAERGDLRGTVEVEVGDGLDVVVREMDVRLDEAGDHGAAAEVQDLRVARTRRVPRGEEIGRA